MRFRGSREHNANPVAARARLVGPARGFALVALAAAAGCGDTTQANEIRNLDRPSDIVFSCYGDLRLTGGNPVPSANDEIVRSAQPLTSCQSQANGEIPPGQGEPTDGQSPILVPPAFFGFALQSGTGSVAVIRFSLKLAEIGQTTVADSDPLTPGKNSIPIGTQPVGLVSSPDGCHVISANGGSCDLSLLDVNSAIDATVQANVRHLAITDATGAPLLARPSAIVGEPAGGTIGVACTEAPDSVVYVAYPECGLVAAVETGTGTIAAGLRFNADGTTEITDGNVSCAAECGSDSLPPLTTAERPVALHFAADGARLYIGAENSPAITIVELDADGLPLSFSRQVVEGDVGIQSLTATGVLAMGGSLGTLGGGAGEMQFVYAIATDNTVRVVEVRNLNVECDTQPDVRFLHDIRDVTLLACLPVGGASTPPRRVGARSPGIHMPRNGVPLDVDVVTIGRDEPLDPEQPAPVDTVGHFAFVSSSDGFVYTVNIDDDNYVDFEDTSDPLKVWMPLAIAHQIRDFLGRRDAVSLGSINVDGVNVDVPICAFPTLAANEGGPRLSAPILRTTSVGRIAPEQVHQLPYLRSLDCEGNDFSGPVPELSFMAPLEIRERTYPDLTEIRSDEEWRITWEGTLSLDTSDVAIDGPLFRTGIFSVGGTGMFLRDGGRPFCKVGVEPFDQVVLSGCDPGAGNSGCGLGETCYVHPEASVASGVCLPSERADSLAGICRDFLVSRRRFSVGDIHSGELQLIERRRVLSTTPVDGCSDDAQCVALQRVEALLADGDNPKDQLPPSPSEYAYTCAPDPSRPGTINRCQMTCETTDDCEAGFECSAGFCVEARIPPKECLETLQRYTVQATDAFVVLGSRTGYLHPYVVDPATDTCVVDPTASPLVTGRIPLSAPACAGDPLDPTALTPNPCLATVTHAEEVPNYADNGSCTSPPGEPDTKTAVREAEAIRFSNPAMTFHLVDPTTTGDAVCRMDRAGTGPAYRTPYAGYQMSFRVIAGFVPLAVPVQPVFPANVAIGPLSDLWILDQGDLVASTFTAFGQIFRVDPAALGGQSATLR